MSSAALGPLFLLLIAVLAALAYSIAGSESWAQHRRRVRTISWEAPSRVASRRLNSGSEPEARQVLRAAILPIGGHTGAVRVEARIMAHRLPLSSQLARLVCCVHGA